MLNRNRPPASSPEHCDEAELRAYLADDLPAAEHARVERHLALCWACSERYEELGRQVRELREALCPEGLLGPQQIARARREFFARYAELEAGLPADAAPSFPTVAGVRKTALTKTLAIAAAIVLAAGLGAWFAARARHVEPSEVLAQTLQHEDSLRLLEGPLHQEFQIDIRQVKPARGRHTGLLSVWYDSRGERFAGRWERDNGKLQYAIWRPEPDREFVFNAQLGATAVARVPQTGKSLTLGELSFEGASLEQLETGFLYWLSNRRWEPISIASDVNVFRLRDGVEADVELVNADDGRQAYRVTARRETGWGVIEVVAEVDAQTYRPKIELLRLSNADRVVELRLRARRTQWLVPGMVEQDLFWPSVSIAGEPGNLADLHRDGDPPAPKMPPPGRLHRVPTAAELDLVEIEARFALHQAGACLGVPVRVERVDGHLVQVGGLVESDERKAELLERLAKLAPSPLLQIDIQTVEEALRRASAKPAGQNPAPADAPSANGERLEVVATDSPIRAELERYLRQKAGATAEGSGTAVPLEQQASDFSDRVVSSSLANLTEAWALRRLAERYGGDAGNRLPPSAAALLHRMLADHNASLRARTAAIQSQIRPLLLTLVANGHSQPPAASAGTAHNVRPGSGTALGTATALANATASGAISGTATAVGNATTVGNATAIGYSTASDAGSGPDADQGDWAALSLRIFQEVESTEAATTGLFADSGNANGARRQGSSEQMAAALVEALPRLESRLRSLGQNWNAQDSTPLAGPPAAQSPARDLP